jgi:hypothetical protein
LYDTCVHHLTVSSSQGPQGPRSPGRISGGCSVLWYVFILLPNASQRSTLVIVLRSSCCPNIALLHMTALGKTLSCTTVDLICMTTQQRWWCQCEHRWKKYTTQRNNCLRLFVFVLDLKFLAHHQFEQCSFLHPQVLQCTSPQHLPAQQGPSTFVDLASVTRLTSASV